MQQGIVKKFRQYNKVHRNVLLTGRQHLLFGVLPQKQKFALAQCYGFAVNTVRGCTGGHVNNLNIIMRVCREADKPCVRAQGNQLTLAQQLAAVNHLTASGHIQAAVNFAAAAKQLPFLLRHGAQHIQ